MIREFNNSTTQRRLSMYRSVRVYRSLYKFCHLLPEMRYRWNTNSNISSAPSRRWRWRCCHQHPDASDFTARPSPPHFASHRSAHAPTTHPFNPLGILPIITAGTYLKGIIEFHATIAQFHQTAAHQTVMA
jgi:hypothetical protein